MNMLFGILGWIKARLVLLAAAAVGVLAAVSAIRRSGRQEERLDRLKEVLENVRTKDETVKKIERLPDDVAARRLRDKWSRD